MMTEPIDNDASSRLEPGIPAGPMNADRIRVVRPFLVALMIGIASGCAPIEREVPPDGATAPAADAFVDSDRPDRLPEVARVEQCNGQDDDGDGRLDEQRSATGEALPCQTNLAGECASGVRRCVIRDGEIVEHCEATHVVRPEICNGKDDDCDEATDEVVMDRQACVTTLTGTCRDGWLACQSEGESGPVAVCEAIRMGVHPENCDGTDDDCDGFIDEGLACGDCQEGDDRPCAETRGACVGREVCERGQDGTLGWSPCQWDLSEAIDERCNGSDDDCDGQVDEGIPLEFECRAALELGECTRGQWACVDGTSRCVSIVEPLPESCNGADDDCDGEVDEHEPDVCETGALGLCALGSSICERGREVCLPVQPAVEEGCADDQCDRETLARCNGLDDDCDGRTDEAFAHRFGSDVGECTPGRRACVDGRLVVEDAVPPTDEVCDGLDNDCDGSTDEGVLNPCGECGEPPDELCNRRDDDCDGSTDEGVLNACRECGLEPVERCNGADDDCDGRTDEGVANACGRCGEEPSEVCDNVDQDCDRRTDEHLERPCGSAVGACRPGLQPCVAGVWQACQGDVSPGQESCNDVDDDCDGRVDEGLTRPVGSNVGACVPGQEACRGGAWVVMAPPVAEQPERCDGVDNDCDGVTDEDAVGLGSCEDERESGLCTEGALRCVAGEVRCESIVEPRPEQCDFQDQDCDGRSDEGATCAGYVERNCHVWLAVSDDDALPRTTPGLGWGPDCPNAAGGGNGERDAPTNIRCVRTNGDGRFERLLLENAADEGQHLDDESYLGVALTCNGRQMGNWIEQMGNWIEQNCALFLGWSESHSGEQHSDVWGGCPEIGFDVAGDSMRCTSSGGRLGPFFQPMRLNPFDPVNRDGDRIMDANERLAVAWRCGSEEQSGEARAAGIQRHVGVFIGWAEAGDIPGRASPQWGGCPAVDLQHATADTGHIECAGTHGDGRFHYIDLDGRDTNGYMADEDAFGIALRQRH